MNLRVISNDTVQDDDACGISGQCTCKKFVFVCLHDSHSLSVGIVDILP